jgi:hypothetical protein
MVSTQQRKWAQWVSLAEWWYNTHFHTALNTTPFQALYGYAPPKLPMGSIPNSRVDTVYQLNQERLVTMQQLKQQLQLAQDRMKRYADRHRSERDFKEGYGVYLKLQPYRQSTLTQKGCKKLNPRYCDPFEVIERVGTVAYRLNFPEGSQIYPVFHVSKLKKKVGDSSGIGLAFHTQSFFATCTYMRASSFI